MTDMRQEQWFTELIRRHQVAMWRYLRFLGCESTLAEDLVQETFVAIWHRPFEDRGEKAARAYLMRAAKNRFLMDRRRGRSRPLFDDLEAADRVWEEQAGDGGDLYQDALQRCLDEVGDKARQGLELFYRDRESRRGVAAALGMSLDGVKTLLRRTRDKLRSCVERRVAS